MPGVKPGDLAISKHCLRSGILMEILFAAPVGGFHLPNGIWHAAVSSHPAWVVKLLSGPMGCPFTDGTKVPVTVGVALDKYVFPLPGDDVEEELATAETASEKL